jgi:AmmeMemoRadiSam system protein A
MPPPLCSDERRQLLLLARTALTEFILHNRVPVVPAPEGRLAECSGAFVTLYWRRRLRGCVGLPGRDLPLGQAVVQAAVLAARYDPRFTAITAEELPDVEIEISVLSEARPIAADAIEVGTHGLLVIRGKNRGLLLPKVATQRSWTAQRFLEEACRKASLAADAWRDSETELLAFTAEVYAESELDPAATGAADNRGPSQEPDAKL